MLKYLLSFTLFISCGKPLKKKSEKDAITNSITLDDQDRLDEDLVSAIIDGDLDLVVELVSKGANLDSSAIGKSSLIIAIENGQLEIAKELIEKGADFNDVKDNDGHNPLELSLLNKMDDLSSYLKDKGANVHNSIKLLLKLYKGQYSLSFIEDTLYSFRANPKKTINLAIKYGREKIIPSLIELGADPELDEKVPALIYASRNGSIAAVKYLIPHSYIDTKDKYGKTPLHYAAENGNLVISKLLKKMGASLTIEDNGKRNACDFAKHQARVRRAIGCSLF